MTLPQRPTDLAGSIQAAFVMVGDPEAEGRLSVQVRPMRDGTIECDVGENTAARRLVLTPEEARVLAEIFERVTHMYELGELRSIAADGPRLANALRDAATLADAVIK